jgi:hypothetical protein
VFFSYFLIAHYDISTMTSTSLRGASPSVADMIQKGVIQYFMEIFVDFANVVWLVVFANQAYLEYAQVSWLGGTWPGLSDPTSTDLALVHAQLHHKYYTVTMASIILAVVFYLTRGPLLGLQ